MLQFMATIRLLASLSIWVFSSTESQRIQHNTKSPPRISDNNVSFSKLNLIRTENLDVEKLNRLISTIDKTWMWPRPGASDPVGSNFQYKKTCASIYKARLGACQQVGFGVMCFNYCFEQGEPLQFRCQDLSDSTYCRTGATFDTTLRKYHNDPYKAKSYIHRMISRCYATAICNPQSGILNTSLIIEENVEYAGSDESSSTITTTRTNSRLPMKKPLTQNQRAISEDDRQRQRLLKMRPTRPVPIWQRLLVTNGTTTTPKSFPIVAATEEFQLTEVPNEENDKVNQAVTESEEYHSSESEEEITESNPEVVNPDSESSSSSSSNQKESQIIERPWWWYAALRQLQRNTDHFKEQ